MKNERERERERERQRGERERREDEGISREEGGQYTLSSPSVYCGGKGEGEREMMSNRERPEKRQETEQQTTRRKDQIEEGKKERI